MKLNDYLPLDATVVVSFRGKRSVEIEGILRNQNDNHVVITHEGHTKVIPWTSIGALTVVPGAAPDPNEPWDPIGG